MATSKTRAAPLKLADSVELLAGVGVRVAAQLARLSVRTIGDLLWHLPIRYENRGQIMPLGSHLLGQSVLVQVTISESKPLMRGKARQVAQGVDASGAITLWQFGRFGPTLQTGQTYLLFGEVREGAHGLEMAQPELMSSAQLEAILPVYPSTEGLSQNKLRALVAQALQVALGDLDELLPSALRQREGWPSLLVALQRIHAPTLSAGLPQRDEPAYVRLIVEELLAHMLALRLKRHEFMQTQAPRFYQQSALYQTLLTQLAFAPTGAQARVLREIQADLARGAPMLRLVQGDVGSGKTLVAAGAALSAIEHGYQVALMAPTALLAEQHQRNFTQWFAPLGVLVQLLSGQQTAAERRAGLAALADGRAQLVIGTHALFQEQVVFAKLGLVIVDEQHRFGVHQRLALSDKGASPERAMSRPHQLVMTATPIPRTLAMSAYADLDVSIIDELPPGRTPITTALVRADRREQLIERISAVCDQGRQAYWVCPLVEDSERIEAQAAQSTADYLRESLPHLRVGLVHGRLSAAEKNAEMARFKAHEVDLLVATTVIEVGVDVPNASLMIIENADRMGLAQLHQLRGRVGRGSVASFCVLLFDEPMSDKARARLQLMRETQDGFKLAEADLVQRGPGEILGTRQTGLAKLKVADLVLDEPWLALARALADELIAEQSPNIPALLRRWIGAAQHYGQV
ncbi:MAG: ATP-dependent DNA helicase RecG [Halothiobacillus sp. 24-54-40]|jgi:ATP-dependent DNA helicase RecG|nr:MAG: ATP-dependent DNA helicase RecG [Halothiobacillus sp. 35-54-62]OYZ86905.1 MAG: ATP-dependent DNA helicase RecG [Halothiobacillus sp. 24-54-40]OZA79587.1 MAG: ATP-dependent DNA helicase RecG [Halothiobacillus sp. 39-53-45]HQS02332.1 ATP-dependent DNA helicase RecG [Halothiobacillus sp.]HQS02924.1 ATP-dependent DNA helicase RecG [Halothiobacillus sp.]